MKRIVFYICNALEQFEHDIKNCIAAMNKGGTFLYPTDTIWGLGCDATAAKAVDKISKIKNRSISKSYIVLVADTQMLRKYLANPIPDLESFITGQKGATTVIYDDIIGIAENALAIDGSLGIRIPKDEFCKALLKRFRKPIVSTSANLNGQSNPTFYHEISENIKEQVNHICAWRQDDLQPQAPSTIIKLKRNGSIIKIR